MATDDLRTPSKRKRPDEEVSPEVEKQSRVNLTVTERQELSALAERGLGSAGNPGKSTYGTFSTCHVCQRTKHAVHWMYRTGGTPHELVAFR